MRAASPRVRIARLVEAYWTEFASAPGLEVIGELVRREVERLQAGERATVENEWSEIRELSLPTDTTWIDQQVIEWAEWRALTQALLQAGDILSKGPKGLDQARDVVSKGLVRLEEPGQRREVALIRDAQERIQKVWIGEDEGAHVPTGFAELDFLLGGGPTKGESHYVLAPPKGAKTSFLIAVGLGAIRRRWGVFMVSYEMRALRVASRIDRGLARASRKELRDDPRILERAIRGLKAVGGGEFYVWESVPQQTRACQWVFDKVRELRRGGAFIDVVILDYLNIMGSSKGETEKRHELARTARDMSALAKQLDVVVWSAALVNRKSMNTRRPQKSDIAEAYEVMAVADGAVAIFGDEAMRARKERGLFAVAQREAEEDKTVGRFRVDIDRLNFFPISEEPPEDEPLPTDIPNQEEPS